MINNSPNKGILFSYLVLSLIALISFSCGGEKGSEFGKAETKKSATVEDDVPLSQEVDLFTMVIPAYPAVIGVAIGLKFCYR